MNHFSFLFSPTAQALGQTLLYSLWQSFIVFICLRLILKCIPQSSAKIKYAISCFAHLGIATWFMVTFIQQLALQRSEFISVEVLQQSSFQQPALNHISTFSGGLSFSFLNNYLPWLVAFYLVGIVWFAMRLMLNYFQTVQLRIKGLNELDSAWLDHIWDLAYKMGIRKPIFTYISQHIETPMMVGFFRPLILLPLSAINNLSLQQIEAVLLHELAHIRRNDYLFNLVQSVMDTVLFFNPFAWWISKNIRNEREKCCDEMVLQLSDPYHYARALLALEEFGDSNQSLMMAAISKRSQLLHRIKNIMEMKNNRINLRQKLITLIIVITGTITLAWLTPKENKAMPSDMKMLKSETFLSVPAVKSVAPLFLGNSLSLKAIRDTNPTIVIPSQPPLPQNPPATPTPPVPPTPPTPPVPPVPPVAALPPLPPLPPTPPLPPLGSLNAMLDSIPSLSNYFNGQEWKKQMEEISKGTASIQKYFQSKAWRQQQQAIQKSAASVKKYFKSAEWKKQQQEIQKSSASIQHYFNSDEWKKQQDEIKKNAEKMQQYFNSDEWKKKQEEIKHSTDSLKKYFNSDAWKKQQQNLQEVMLQTKKYFQSDEWKKHQEEFKKIMKEK